MDPFAAVQNVDDFYRILQYGPEPLGQYDPPPPALPPLPTPALHLGGQRSGGDLMSSLETGSRLAAPGGPDPHHDWWPISGEGKTDGQLDGLSIVPTGKSAEDEEGDEEGEGLGARLGGRKIPSERPSQRKRGSRNPVKSEKMRGTKSENLEVHLAKMHYIKGEGQWGLKWGSVTTLSETHRAIMISDKTHTKKEEELVQLCAEFAGFVARFNLDSSVLGNEEYLEFVRFLSEDADLRFNPEDESPGFSFLSGARHEVFGMASEALAKLFKLGTPTRLKQKLKACQFLFYVDKSGRQYFYHDEFRPGHDGEEASEFIALQQDKVKFKDLQCKRPPPELRAATSEDAKKKRNAKAQNFVLALGLCTGKLLMVIRSEFSSRGIGRVTSGQASRAMSLNQLATWARDESVSLEDLDRGIEVAMGCQTLAHGGIKSGLTVKFAEKFAEAENMNESERAELMASEVKKLKAERDYHRKRMKRKTAQKKPEEVLEHID